VTVRGPVRTAYVLTVATVATVGFTTGSTAAILLAGLLALPASIPTAVGFYLAYGLLALVPGASPGSSSGSATCTPAGECHESSTGDLATWFVVATDVAGILLLTTAALLNVAFVGILRRKLRGSASASDRTRSGA
jgi:disulfide bond formation protein DsbB